MIRPLLSIRNALCASTLLFSIGTAHSALILYEGFDYSPVGANVSGESGGSGAWNGSWESNVGTVASSLTYPGLETNGNALDAGSNFDNARSWDTTGVGADGTSNWFSGLVTLNADGSANRFLFSETSSAQGFGFEAIGSGGNYSVAARADGVNGTSTGSVTQGTTSFVIGRIDWSDTVNDTVSIWLNPADFSSVAALGGAGSTASDEVDQFSEFYPRNGSGFTIDEIRLGDTLADVTPVPEPSTAVLLAAAGALVFGMRRRRA